MLGLFMELLFLPNTCKRYVHTDTIRKFFFKFLSYLWFQYFHNAKHSPATHESANADLQISRVSAFCIKTEILLL